MNFSTKPLLFLSLLALASSCQVAPSGSGASGEAALVRSWGGLREVLREGRSEGRVELVDVIGPDSIALGSLAGLAGEITVVDGVVHLAGVEGGDPAGGLWVRSARAGDEATILALSDVPVWSESPLPGVADNAALEALVLARASAAGLDVSQPFPFRIEGVAASLDVHVLNSSCPIAQPEGPKPWRFAGEREVVTLVGFYAKDGAGRLTHHGQKTHIHVVLPGQEASGHVDAIALEPGAQLALPALTKP
jgi:hypothetical protein